MAKIYHKEIGFPGEVESVLNKEYKFTFTNHAKQACRTDRYGFIIPPVVAKVTKENLIEVEIEGKQVVKILIRLPYDENKDVLIAFIPETNTGVVKTLWLNTRADKHLTLDRNKYDLPGK